MYTSHSLITHGLTWAGESGMTHQVPQCEDGHTWLHFRPWVGGCSSTVQVGQGGTGVKEGRPHKWLQDREGSYSVKRSACVGGLMPLLFCFLSAIS